MRTLAFYTQPGVMTSAGRSAPLLEALPGDSPASPRSRRAC